MLASCLLMPAPCLPPTPTAALTHTSANTCPAPCALPTPTCTMLASWGVYARPSPPARTHLPPLTHAR